MAVDKRKWITAYEASVVWRMTESDILSRLKEGRDWVQMRRWALVNVAQMCRLFGREPWVRWGVEESAEEKAEGQIDACEQLQFDMYG